MNVIKNKKLTVSSLYKLFAILYFLNSLYISASKNRALFSLHLRINFINNGRYWQSIGNGC